MTEDEMQIKALVKQLLDESREVAEDAQFELQKRFGPRGISQVIEALPNLPDWGTTLALEFLETVTEEPIPDPKTCALVEDVAISTLENDREQHRYYAAGILYNIGTDKAIDPLKLALERTKSRGTPQDYMEPSRIRAALRKLGVSVRYDSSLIQSLIADAFFDECWLVEDALTVLEELHNQQQLVVNLQTWRNLNGKYYWSDHNTKFHHDRDYSKPFETIVEETYRTNKEHLQSVKKKKKTIVTMDWLGKNDWHNFGAST